MCFSIFFSTPLYGNGGRRSLVEGSFNQWLEVLVSYAKVESDRRATITFSRTLFCHQTPIAPKTCDQNFDITIFLGLIEKFSKHVSQNNMTSTTPLTKVINYGNWQLSVDTFYSKRDTYLILRIWSARNFQRLVSEPIGSRNLLGEDEWRASIDTTSHLTLSQ